MITYQPEKLAMILDEMKPLYEAHFAEIEPAGTFMLKPNIAGYINIEQAGYLHMITMRDTCRLVGYIIMLIQQHPYAAGLIAYTDKLFIEKASRKGYAATYLIKAAEDYCRTIKVYAMQITTKTDPNYDFGKLLVRKGFEAIERTHQKILREAN